MAVKKWVKYSLKTVAWIAALLAAIWIGLAIYISLNEKKLIDKLSSAVNEYVKGETAIEGLSVSLFTTFPSLSMTLSNVHIKDSLYASHHKELLSAKTIHLSVNIAGLLSGESPVGKITISGGDINIITDTAGISNDYLLRNRNNHADGELSNNAPGKKEYPGLPVLLLKNVQVNFQHALRNKLYQAYINRLHCSFHQRGDKLLMALNANLLVNHLAFNTHNGSFLQNKTLKGRFDLAYDRGKKELLAEQVKLYLQGHPFFFNGRFHLDQLSPDYSLSIETKNIDSRKLVSLLAENLQEKTKKYSFKKGIDVKADISGKTEYKFIPLVRLGATIKNNDLETPFGVFENCAFKGTFSNEMDNRKPRSDQNAVIDISSFSARWENIPLVSQSLRFTDLQSPLLEGDLKTDLQLTSLNALTGSSTFNFEQGDARVDILFKCPLGGRNGITADIKGDVLIRNAAIRYLPRNFLLSQCQGALRFRDNDLIVDKFNARVGKTLLQMNGQGKNFLSMLNLSPEKLVLNWKIYSDHARLEDFKAFLAKSPGATRRGSATRWQDISSRIDRLFREGDVYVKMETPAMSYKTFTATDVQAGIVMKPSTIAVDQMSFKHAGGSVSLRGKMDNGLQSNIVSLETAMRDIDIPVLFSSFANFGQDALTKDNLKGRLSADIRFSAAITNEAELIKDKSKGTIAFLLEDGELNNFEPLQRIAEKAFKKQDFSAVRFADLRNVLELNGSTFIINNMEIRSTALHLFVEGVYDLNKGTDMSIRFPMRNLLKSQAKMDITNEGKQKAGIALRIRAKTGDDGKLKISWDPFGKSKSNKENQADSAAFEEKPGKEEIP